jgi:DNA-binding response OmpR family regulator
MPRFRVLVVDDEPMVTEVVERYLVRDGFDVSTSADGDEALTLARTWAPDLIVLDLMLPGKDGLEVCRSLRRDSNVPIIMLTARGDETDRIVGLEIGADDYIVKPFSPRELVARIKAVLRRSADKQEANSTDLLRFSGLTINPRTRAVEVSGKSASLTAKEFDLLHYLASHAEQVFSREQLMNDVWDYTFAGDASTVTVHVRRLREKIEPDPLRPRFVKTVWGVGYKFER